MARSSRFALSRAFRMLSRRLRTVAWYKRSSDFVPPIFGTETNEELWGSPSIQWGLCLPAQEAAANAAFLPTIKCSGRGNGTLYRGRWEPDVERYGAVFNKMT